MKNMSNIVLRANVLTLLSVVVLMGLMEGAEASGHRQRARIRQGVRSGELSHDEARTLRSEQKSIHDQAQQARSDGQVSTEERKALRESRRTASEHIHELKHNDVHSDHQH
jgi:ribosome recycling factor